ncbi:MAG: A/G-specific adenine glycosylase [Gammaproteobacteria bacterium]|nr:A/G-specific adenine glycosylase [Gammaproteobacteria bacterium]
MRSFAERVVAWYALHGRKDLPWQQQPTPYRVWISEVMLQQTQVETVIPYYQRFMQSFPDVEALAQATQDQVLAHWSGLGYYARGRNIHATAGIVVEQYKGIFPTDLDQVMALPGIGRSTAAAILALSAGIPHPILDGNVKRVLARVHCVEGWPGQSRVAAELWSLAERYMPQQDVREYTQAMMDLGAGVCTRRQPACGVCPLQVDCQSYKSGRQSDFPGTKARKKLAVRSTQMLILCTPAQEVLLELRPPTGIWGGLWSLPEFDNDEDLVQACQQRLGYSIQLLEHGSVIRHTFSHFHLDITPVRAVVEDTLTDSVLETDDYVWYNIKQSSPGGMASPVQRILEQLKEACNDTNGAVYKTG